MPLLKREVQTLKDNKKILTKWSGFLISNQKGMLSN